jgi:putative endonuclease
MLFKTSSKEKGLSMGTRGEKTAIKYLRKNNYKILESNFFNTRGRRLGEIDIIADDGSELVFIEVKTRTEVAQKILLPEESITPKKLHKLEKVASFYVSKNKLQNKAYRFDAISIIADPEKRTAKLRHIKNIFL